MGAIQCIALFIQAGFLYKDFTQTREALILSQRPKLIVRNIIIPELEMLHEKTPIALLENILNGSFYVANIGASLTEIREVHSELFIGEKLPPELEAHLKRLN